MLVFCFAIFHVNLLQARENPVNRLQSDSARRLTVEAVKDIENKGWEDAKRKIAESKDPLASKIYHWLLLVHAKEDGWTNEMFIRLSHFIRNNPEWPDVSKLIVQAEGTMPAELSNAEVIAWYNDFPPKTGYGMGRYIDALLIEGQHAKAKELVAKWWASTLVSRDQQRDIFQKYGRYLTIDAHKKRFDSLLRNKHYDNARAVADVLGQGYPELAEARIALASGKNSGLNQKIDAVPSFLQDDPGLLYERLHWRRKKNLNDGALEILLNAPKEVSNPKAWWTERHIMIRRVLEKKDFETAYTLASSHVQKEGFSFAQAQWIAGWLALRYMNKPTDAYERFSALYDNVSTPVSRARAAYWAGLAAQALQQQSLAREWFSKAIEFNTVFYGQMARAALSMKEELPDKRLPNLSRSDRADYNKSEMIQAAEIFESAGKDDLSKRFIDAFLSTDSTPKAYRYIAEKLAKKGDFYSAVRIAKKASSQGLFLTKQAYPTITKHLGGINDAEWALIHALIRQESMFDYSAKSHAGALGLMQLMPATAKSVSKKIGEPYQKAWLTEKPIYNITLGATYIGKMIEKYQSYPLAIAAYNAGPGRVDSWLRTYGDPRTGEVNIIDWIELIPVYETRNYVQRVMENVYVYRLILKDIQAQPERELHVANHVKP